MEKRTLTREQLVDLYVNQGFSQRQIGEKCGVLLRTVGKWLQKDGIAARPRGAPVGCNTGARKDPLSKDLLDDLYLAKGMTQCEIAAMYGLSEWSVGRRLREFGIEARPTNYVRDTPRKRQFTPEELKQLYVSDRRTMRDIAWLYDMHPVTVAKWLRRYGIPIETAWERRGIDLDPVELKRLYSEVGMTVKQLAKHFGCSPWTVKWNMRRNDILVLNPEHQQVKKRIDMVGSPGLKDHRNYAMAHDEHGDVAPEHRLVAENALGRKLTNAEVVHHINRIKTDNRIENLVVLPNSAFHRRVHGYTELVGLFLCGLTDIRPEALDFGAPVFWGGRYVTSIDLIPPGATRAFGQLALGPTTSQETTKEVVN